MIEEQILNQENSPVPETEPVIPGTPPELMDPEDLTLFTCTYGRRSRIVVYCDTLEA